jgi:hypothetical protein
MILQEAIFLYVMESQLKIGQDEIHYCSSVYTRITGRDSLFSTVHLFMLFIVAELVT